MTGDCVFIDGSYNKHRRRRTIVLDPLRSLYDWSADLLRFILTILCGGCNYTATKRISKTASTTSISKTQRATRFNVWSNISLIATVFIMTQLLAIGQVDAMTMRPRQLRKRHSVIDAAVGWENPCGGVFEASYAPVQSQKKASLKVLRKFTRDTYHTLTADDKWININDIQVWFKHNQTYKFMPKLRKNSSVALKRWYRNMQTYVAAFSYLHNTQRKFDEAKHTHHEGNISAELKSLLHEARSMLCEIESTINNTLPSSSEKKLTTISLQAMNKRLKFRTKKHLADNLYMVDPIDLKFTKFYFYEFLHTMSMILKHNLSSSELNKSTSSGDVSINWNSRSVSSNEINASRSGPRRGRKRPAKKHNPNRSRQRSQKNTSVAIA